VVGLLSEVTMNITILGLKTKKDEELLGWQQALLTRPFIDLNRKN